MRVHTTRPKKYADRPGEGDLLHALNLLFQIKGKLYRPASPDFTIPCAEEFLSFARRTNDEIFVHSRTTVGLRPLMAQKLATPHLIDFLAFVLQSPPPTNLSGRFNMCLNIVTYAVFVYVFVSIFLKTCATKPNDRPALVLSSMRDVSNRRLFAIPATWFCAYYMPVLDKYKACIAEIMYIFLQTNAVPSLERALKQCVIPDHNIVHFLGTFVTTTFDTTVLAPKTFDHLFNPPVMGFLKRNSSLKILDP